MVMMLVAIMDTLETKVAFAMEHFADKILSAPPDAALTTKSNAAATTIQIVCRVMGYHVQKTVFTPLGMEGVVNTAAVTRMAFSALITTPDASTTRLINQIIRKVVAVLLTITAAAAALTSFGSGFCSR